MTPHPVRLEGELRSERQIIEHRKLACAHYRACLDHSVAEGWEGFSCVHCELAPLVPALKSRVEAFAHARKGEQ